ncbi:MAG: hypothetical protein PPP58_08070 [Natronomonas sp.]
MSTDSPEASASDSGGDLPPIVRARPPGVDDCSVVRFGNGAEIRYRSLEDGIEEAWVPPDGSEPVRAHRRENTDETTLEAAFRTVGTYLSFESRERAAFSWGEDNLAVILGTH